MRPLKELSYGELEQVWSSLQPRLSDEPSFQGAAQTFVESLYAGYGRSIVLVRMFLTVPYGMLPAAERRFVRRLSLPPGALTDTTPVLTLLGTCGLEPAWRDRLESESHLAIPLVSREFVGDAPMIAQLLSDMNYEGPWPLPRTRSFVTPGLANLNGLFYVPDARTAVDETGRYIIPAREFVARYDIQTVFGVGGAFAVSSEFLALVVFCNGIVARSDAAKFMPMSSWLKTVASPYIKRGAIFG